MKIYLFEKSSYTLEDGGDSFYLAFNKKEDALKLLQKEVDAFKKDAEKLNMVMDEDEQSVEFYIDGFYSENHHIFSVTEIELDYVTEQMFAESVASTIMMSDGFNLEEEEDLKKYLTTTLCDDKELWECFNQEAYNQIQDDERYIQSLEALNG